MRCRYAREDRPAPPRGKQEESGLRRQPLATSIWSLDSPPFAPLLGPLFTPHFGDAVPDALSGDGRFFERPLAQGFQAVATFGAPAAFRSRIRQPGLDHAFVFQAVERDVNGAQRNGLG